MPDGKHYNDEDIGAAITAGSVTVDQLRDSCNRVMSGWHVRQPSPPTRHLPGRTYTIEPLMRGLGLRAG